MDFSSVGKFLTTIRDGVMFIAEKISIDNSQLIFYLIFGAIALLIANKIFFMFWKNKEKRWHIFLIIAGIIFFILALLKLT